MWKVRTSSTSTAASVWMLHVVDYDAATGATDSMGYTLFLPEWFCHEPTAVEGTTLRNACLPCLELR